MIRVAWLTDIHLNFVSPEEGRRFLDEVFHAGCDAVLIGGDIAEAPTLPAFLRQIGDAATCPVYFVLGNHDFYHGSIAGVRADAVRLSRENPRLVYLTTADAISLSPQLALAGHDGWADGWFGDYERSYVMMNDYRLIQELARHDKESRLPVLRALGEEAAAHARRVLPAALERHEHALFLTHVPPFREACWHEGQISDHEWLPHFTCRALGLALVEIMRARPDRRLTVLCGHTHSPGETQPLPSLTVHTGGATYGRPAVTRYWEFE